MTNNFLNLTVLPYRSLSKKGFKYLMIWVTSIFLGIGIFFWKIGAWPVFGFLGLDVLMLYYAFKINYKSGEIFENLRLLDKKFEITRCFPSGKQQTWDLEPYWLKAEITGERNNKNLIIKSKEKIVLVGSFLNINDKKKLLKKIEEAIEKYKLKKNLVKNAAKRN